MNENKNNMSDNLEETNNSSDLNSVELKGVKKTGKSNKKIFVVGGCILALAGVSIFMLNNLNNNEDSEVVIQEDVTSKVTLDFENKTAEDMREYYTPEGQEFIKIMYPDSDDSNLALLTVGKSTQKEWSDVKFKTSSNKEVSLKDLKGKRVILDFAMVGCPNCKEEFHYLFNKKTGENDVFLHVFPQDTTEDLKNILNEMNIEFNPDKTITFSGMNNLGFEDFNITHVPCKIYINEDGIVTYVTTNTLQDDETYNLHYERAFGEGEKMLDFLKDK